eukprot:jgi/Tetstr1/422516/TSEL_001277.t1
MSAHMRTCAVQLQAAPSQPANGVVGLRTRRSGQPAGARRSVAALARPERSVKDTVVAIWEGLGSMADFESWAPRSARAWRLREVPNEVAVKSAQEAEAAEEAAYISALVGAKEAEEGDAAVAAGGALVDYTSLSRFQLTMQAALEGMEAGADVLTGATLAEMCFGKYGKYHDMSIKHVTMNKGKTRRWVALNLYVGYVGQRTFPYNEEEYIEKLDSIAMMLNAWDQVEYTRAFFAEPPIPRRGLPSRPRVDTAVSLRLNASPNWDDALADEFFTY